MAALLFVARGDASAQQRAVNERAAVTANTPIRIHLYAGRIDVIGWDRDSITVRGSVNEPDGERFYFTAGPGGAKMGLWPERADSLPPSRLEVRVPHGASVWVKTVSAAIDARELTGTLDLYSVSGAITASGAPRELHAESMAGPITADVTTRSARLRSASGGVELRGRIDEGTVETVTGAIHVANAALTRARIESVDGDIVYDAPVQRAAALDFINHAGTVELRLQTGTAATLVVNSYSGELDNRIGASLVRAANRFKGSEYTVTLNGGGAHIGVRTFKGAVILRR